MCCLWATKLTWDASICHVMSSHHPDDVVYRTTSLWFDRSLIKRGTFSAGRQTSQPASQTDNQPDPISSIPTRSIVVLQQQAAMPRYPFLYISTATIAQFWMILNNTASSSSSSGFVCKDDRDHHVITMRMMRMRTNLHNELLRPNSLRIGFATSAVPGFWRRCASMPADFHFSSPLWFHEN